MLLGGHLERKNGWSIADCTAEAIKALLHCHDFCDEPIEDGNLRDAVRFLLSYQNRDGGWASCDRVLGPSWLELLNSSHVFADIMIDHSFVECTASAVTALRRVRGRFPELDASIERATRRGTGYIARMQRPDGSWEACWGICFTYATYFAMDALVDAGIPTSHPSIRKGCRFLLERQLVDGGWGEEPESCVERRYVSTREGLVEQTAWAVLALIAGGQGGSEAVRRGVAFLVARQQPDGDWPRQPICGLFFRTTLISYENYKRYFPMLALARYLRVLAEPPAEKD